MDSLGIVALSRTWRLSITEEKLALSQPMSASSCVKVPAMTTFHATVVPKIVVPIQTSYALALFHETVSQDSILSGSGSGQTRDGVGWTHQPGPREWARRPE